MCIETPKDKETKKQPTLSRAVPPVHVIDVDDGVGLQPSPPQGEPVPTMTTLPAPFSEGVQTDEQTRIEMAEQRKKQPEGPDWLSIPLAATHSKIPPFFFGGIENTGRW